MPDYTHGKVYRLVSPDGHFYIGSTAQPILRLRLAEHNYNAKQGKTTRLYTYLRTTDMTIELIEAFPCESRTQLQMREQEHLAKADTTLCLNEKLAHLTRQETCRRQREYYQRNAEKCKASVREYYQAHREEKLAYQRGYNARTRLTP